MEPLIDQKKREYARNGGRNGKVWCSTLFSQAQKASSGPADVLFPYITNRLHSPFPCYYRVGCLQHIFSRFHIYSRTCKVDGIASGGDVDWGNGRRPPIVFGLGRPFSALRISLLSKQLVFSAASLILNKRHEPRRTMRRHQRPGVCVTVSAVFVQTLGLMKVVIFFAHTSQHK